jgi:hypothetical protein
MLLVGVVDVGLMCYSLILSKNIKCCRTFQVGSISPFQ